MFVNARFVGIVMFCLVCLHGAAADEIRAPFRWPGGARVAVSLSYDDALGSQLDNAVPALNAHGLRGSFYLTLASETIANRLPEWRKAAMQGHELGNHTMFHPCSRAAAGREWVEAHRDLDKISVRQMRQEILLANSFLHAIDGKRIRTFTAPCADTKAAGEPYLPAVESEFVAIKSQLGGITPNMMTLDPSRVGTATPDQFSGQQLIEIVKRGAVAGTMTSITFHGIGGDYLSVSKEAHDALLKHLSANPDIYWVDTFVNIMTYVRSVQGR